MLGNVRQLRLLRSRKCQIFKYWGRRGGSRFAKYPTEDLGDKVAGEHSQSGFPLANKQRPLLRGTVQEDQSSKELGSRCQK